MAEASLAEMTFVFEADAHHVKSREALINAFMPIARRVGAAHFLCAYVGDDVSGKSIKRAISNIPREWQEGYLARGYEASDPVFLSVTQTGACGYWDELSSKSGQAGGMHEMMGFAARIGMHDGFTKRVTLDAGGSAIMMVGGKKLDRSAEARTALRLSTHIFANEAARMLPISTANLMAAGLEELSPSQMQVLQMRAEGWSNIEVAARTGTVPKTVESHVTQILRRLKARNMIDAIRIAKDTGLLS